MPLSPEERKEKARWARILKVYGLTPDQYKELDNGHCPVCTRNWDDTVRPCIDHNHVTGKVRGLLCTYCNRYRVGRFTDPDIVQRIVDYLRNAIQIPYIVPPKPKKKRKKKKVKI